MSFLYEIHFQLIYLIIVKIQVNSQQEIFLYAEVNRNTINECGNNIFNLKKDFLKH